MSGGTTIVLLVAVLVIAALASSLSATRRRADREQQLRELFAARASRTPQPAEGELSRGPHPVQPRTTPTDRFVDEQGNVVERAAPAAAGAAGAHPPGTAGSGGSPRGVVLHGTLPLPPAQEQLTTRDHDAPFAIEPPADLPTFAAIGGMDDFKRDIHDTVGLMLAHSDKADAYGITWNGLLLHGPPGVGKTFLARAIAGEHALNLLHLSTGDLVEGVVGQSAKNVQRAFAAAAAHRPCLLLFDEFDSVAQRRDGGTHAEERRTVNQLLTCLEEQRGAHDLVVVATTNDVEHLDPAVIRPGRLDRHVRVDLPDAAARQAVLASQLRHRPSCDGVDLADLARRTQGLTPAALAQLVDAAALRAFREASQAGALVRITHAHLLEALAARGGTDRPTVEDWDWDQLILAPHVREELQQLQLLVEDPDLADGFGVTPPTGVLLAGPPGTGKTTVARVLAAQARCSFYPVSAADVTSKWAGESERSIARLFARARENRPAIIFIDEIDALGARREAATGDAAARQLNQLLTEMDGLTGSRGVLVMGATNRAELLDPALVRGGRLSRTITLELPDRHGRLAMLQLMTARMPTVDVDLHALAAATAELSGADLKAVCQQAALHALVRARQAADPDAEPAVLHADFDRAIADRRASAPPA